MDLTNLNLAIQVQIQPEPTRPVPSWQDFVLFSQCARRASILVSWLKTIAYGARITADADRLDTSVRLIDVMPASIKPLYGMFSFTLGCPGCVPLALPLSALAPAEPVAPRSIYDTSFLTRNPRGG
jgi:hypothetical protein